MNKKEFPMDEKIQIRMSYWEKYKFEQFAIKTKENSLSAFIRRCVHEYIDNKEKECDLFIKNL